MAVLTLGGVVFSGWELPESVPLGGKHAGTMHELPGGVRIFDAKGPSDAPIKWSARFRGQSAISRAQRVDTMRKSGAQTTLSVMGMSYTVVVTDFVFDIIKPYEVNYHIECTVITDNVHGIDILDIFGVSGLDGIVATDIAAAAAYLTGASQTAALAALESSIATAGKLATASLSTLQPVKNAAESVMNDLDAAIAATDAAIATDPIGVTPLDDGAANIVTARDALATQAAQLAGYAYVGRAAANLRNDAG